MIRLDKPTLHLATALSVLVLSGGSSCLAFVVPSTRTSNHRCVLPAEIQPFTGMIASKSSTPTQLFSTPEDEVPDAEGADLAAQFFQMAQAKGVSIDESDLLEDDEDDEDDDGQEYDGGYGNNDDDDDEEDDIEPNIPQGAIDAFVGYDTSDVDANPTVDISNDQLYSEVKERVLDTAGGFVEMTRGAVDDDDDYYGDGNSDVREYVPPTTVPDAELTAGEVVLLVLTALKNNDNSYVNRGLEILFGYSSPGSQIKNEEGLTPAEYGQFLKETEYTALFEHLDATIEKGEYSFDGKKGFFTARLQTGTATGDSVSVNFILSSVGEGDDSAWLIDSMLIRPQSMRRRRRK